MLFTPHLIKYIKDKYMNVSRELIQAAFNYDFDTNKFVDTSLDIFDVLEDKLGNELDFNITFTGDAPWFNVYAKPMRLLFWLEDQDNVSYELEINIGDNGDILRGELDNMKNFTQELDFG